MPRTKTITAKYTITRYVKGQERVAHYATLEVAKAVASEIFKATGVVVGIEKIEKIAKLGNCPRCGFAGCNCVN